MATQPPVTPPPEADPGLPVDVPVPEPTDPEIPSPSDPGSPARPSQPPAPAPGTDPLHEGP